MNVVQMLSVKRSKAATTLRNNLGETDMKNIIKNAVKNAVKVVNTTTKKMVEKRRSVVESKFENKYEAAAGYAFGKILARSGVLIYSAVKASKRGETKKAQTYICVMVGMAYVDVALFAIDCNAIEANLNTKAN